MYGGINSDAACVAWACVLRLISVFGFVLKQMRGLVALTVAAAFELAAAVTAPAGGLVVPGSSRVLARPGRMDSALRLRGGGKDKMHWYADP